MGRKAPISLISESMVKSIAKGPWWVQKEIRKHGELQNRLYPDYIVSDLIDFFWPWLKGIKKQIEKSKVYVHEKLISFKYFPWIFWAHHEKIMLWSVLFPNENQKPNHYFQIFSVTKFLRIGWIKQPFLTEHLSTSCFDVGCF